MDSGPCINYEFCEGKSCDVSSNSTCMACGSWFHFGHGWDALAFVDSSESCSICLEDVTRKMMFPTNCGHSFCISCSRNILLWDETMMHLSPVPYGCPPCPNGCDVVVRGRQCYCDEYNAVQNEWELSDPIKYNEWNEAENISIDMGPGGAYASKTCPICRSKYVR